jgi:hypothetical protein
MSKFKSKQIDRQIIIIKTTLPTNLLSGWKTIVFIVGYFLFKYLAGNYLCEIIEGFELFSDEC